MELLIDVLKSDTEKGMRMLFDKYYKSLVISSFLILKDEVVAEDVVQDMFYNFLRNNTYLNLTESALKPYLYASVRNLSIDIIRRRNRFSEIDISGLEFVDPEVSDSVYTECIIVQIKREIELLPPKTRRVVEDLLFMQMKYKDISEKYDVSLNTVKTLIQYGLKAIRTNMKKKYQYFFTLFLSLIV